MAFTKARKSKAKGRLALFGPSGSGKTWTALIFATVLAGPSGRIAVIDTENASADKYADAFSFDSQALSSFKPEVYINAIHEAEEAGYDVLIIDSVSHAWAGKDGVLALVDAATARSRSGNAFTTGWREVTPQHNALVDALVQCRCHLIVTCRVKSDWVVEEVNGKKTPRKIGLAPVQRDGLEYEFDVAGDIDLEHRLVITKSRCPGLADGVFHKPDAKVAAIFRDWLDDGVETKPAPRAPAAEPEKALARATPEQVREINLLLAQVELPEGTTAKWLAKAGAASWGEMPAENIAACIDYLKHRQKTATPESKLPPPNTAVEHGDEGQGSNAPPVDPVDEALSQDWENVLRSLWAKAHKAGYAVQKDFTMGVQRWVLAQGCKGKEAKIPLAKRRELYEAIGEKRFNLAGGTITKTQPAAPAKA